MVSRMTPEELAQLEEEDSSSQLARNGHKNPEDLENMTDAAMQRYRQTEKGKNAVKRYNNSDAAREASRKYAQSDKGKEAMLRWRNSVQGKKAQAERKAKIERAKQMATWEGQGLCGLCGGEGHTVEAHLVGG